ncbi:50S ribosomal protein L15 [bacterium]|nr:50S ribosomal protein L15 [bacterium]
MILSLHNLKAPKRQKKKRVGRGESSGLGKTAGRGTKGQKARSGKDIPKGFEGGQTPLKQRLPKFRGIKPKVRKDYAVLTLEQIERVFEDGEEVSLESLRKKGLIEEKIRLVKLIGDKIGKKVKVKDCLLSKGAKKALGLE